jgi:DNA modification methylase
MIAPNSIINGDCLEVMKDIDDRSIDCIIADLPYGVTNCTWDLVIPFDKLWEQYKRIIKPNGAIAAINTNRQYICIEKDPHYFEVMRNRIANHDPFAPVKTKKPKAAPKGQLTLFDGGLAV